MSRWKSPEAAGRRARMQEAKLLARIRERRRAIAIVIGVATVSVGLMMGDFFLIRSQARERAARHRERKAQLSTSNQVANPPASTNQVAP